MPDCLFCKIIDKEIPADMVHEDDACVAFRDINPQAPTHIQIIPRKHIPTTNDIAQEDAELLAHMLFVGKDLACKEGVAESGYRLLFNCNAHAGQSVFHIHLHLLGGRQFTWPPG